MISARLCAVVAALNLHSSEFTEPGDIYFPPSYFNTRSEPFAEPFGNFTANSYTSFPRKHTVILVHRMAEPHAADTGLANAKWKEWGWDSFLCRKCRNNILKQRGGIFRIVHSLELKMAFPYTKWCWSVLKSFGAWGRTRQCPQMARHFDTTSFPAGVNIPVQSRRPQSTGKVTGIQSWFTFMTCRWGRPGHPGREDPKVSVLI